MTKLSYHQEVANKIIEQLKQGQAPWIKPWEAGSAHVVPFNPVTNKRYRGINALHLMHKENKDNRWLTYNQAQSMDAQVKKGEKGTKIQYWKFFDEKTQKDESGKVVIGIDGIPVKSKVALERPSVFYATVFNASQIDNMPELAQETRVRSWDLNEKAESILSQSGAKIEHSENNRAFYRAITDTIHLPPKDQFKSPDKYYATALHELGHWTGHESRLDRGLNNPFGSEAYAKEELRAEIASMLLGDDLGIGHDPSQHTAYISSWIKVLENDPVEIFRAAADAEKIVSHINSIEQKQEQQLTPHIETKDENQKDEVAMKLPQSEEKTWLNIPYHQKDTVKSLAGQLDDGSNAISWDKTNKKWFAKEGANLEVLKPWLVSLKKDNEENEVIESLLKEKTWLIIPYSQKDTAKSIVGKLDDGTPGLAWDKVDKCWYARPGVASDKIKSWLPENTYSKQESSMSPVDEFKETLISLGAIISSNHPIMDGKPHRITAEGDKAGEKTLFYVGHLDGVPAGYIKNNRTGIELKWKSKGYVLSNEEKTKLKATALKKQQHRDNEITEKQQNAALKIQKKLSQLKDVTEPTPYLKSKGIHIHSGIYVNEENKTTCIPAIDVDGKVWSMQYISDDGKKRFAKDAKKEGCFHVLGGIEKLKTMPVIIISEGYATAATIKEAADLPAVVSAFDAGNLKSVAKALNEKYPDASIIIAADDDKYLEDTKGINPGKDKATDAAKEVNGTVVLPVFSPNEQSNNPKQFTDFNDLAQKSSLGISAVKRQVKSIIKQVSKKSTLKTQKIISRVTQMA